MAYDQSNTTIIGMISGMIGGMFKYIFLDMGLMGRMVEAGFTAFFCGVMGVAGKYAFERVKKWYYKRLKNKP